MKPVLLMDVDGVLNPYGALPRKFLKHGFVKHVIDFDGTGNDLVDVHLNQEHGRFLTTLSDHFDPYWCTFWNHKANTLLTPLLGIDFFPVFELATDEESLAFPRTGYHWKTAQIQARFKTDGDFAGRRFAWVDDETTKSDQRYFDAIYGKNFHKLIRVSHFQGFTNEQLSRLLEWGASVNGN